MRAGREGCLDLNEERAEPPSPLPPGDIFGQRVSAATPTLATESALRSAATCFASDSAIVARARNRSTAATRNRLPGGRVALRLSDLSQLTGSPHGFEAAYRAD